MGVLPPREEPEAAGARDGGGSGSGFGHVGAKAAAAAASDAAWRLSSRAHGPRNVGFRPKPRRGAGGGLLRLGSFPNLLAAPQKQPAGPRAPSPGLAGRRPALVWFRKDLRLADHDALARANKWASRCAARA